jgi:hypothetical protein
MNITTYTHMINVKFLANNVKTCLKSLNAEFEFEMAMGIETITQLTKYVEIKYVQNTINAKRFIILYTYFDFL